MMIDEPLLGQNCHILCDCAKTLKFVEVTAHIREFSNIAMPARNLQPHLLLLYSLVSIIRDIGEVNCYILT